MDYDALVLWSPRILNPDIFRGLSINMSQQLTRDPRGQYHQQRENHPKIKPGLTSNSNGLSVLITTLGIGIILVSYIFCGAFIFSSLEGHSGKKRVFI